MVKNYSSSVTKIVAKTFEFNERIPINPITYQNKTYFKLINYFNNKKNKNLFTYDITKYTIFIGRERKYEADKNHHK